MKAVVRSFLRGGTSAAGSRVVGLSIYGAPTPLAAQLARRGTKTITMQDTSLLGKLVERADADMNLGGELVRCYAANFDARAGHVALHDWPRTDEQWVRELESRFRGKKWQCRRYASPMTEYVIVALLS